MEQMNAVFLNNNNWFWKQCQITAHVTAVNLLVRLCSTFLFLPLAIKSFVCGKSHLKEVLRIMQTVLN